VELRREVTRLYQAWRKNQPEEPHDSLGATTTPASATSTLEEAEETAWLEVEQYLQSMNPYQFQELVAALLRAMDYHIAWVSPPGPDQGLDILAYTDPLGATGPRIKVQVKRRADKITVDGLRASWPYSAARTWASSSPLAASPPTPSGRSAARKTAASR